MSQSDKSKASLAEKKQIENETVFRNANEKVQAELDSFEKTANANSHVIDSIENTKLHFLCECSDENCMERVITTLKQYKKMHSNRRNFVVRPGHEAVNIEKVIAEKKKYNLVRKFITPPEIKAELQQTNTNNV